MENQITEEIIVAAIIETGKIVINKGKNDGIYDSMEFVVYIEGCEVIDPISKIKLGNLENPKGTFKVLHVQNNMTTLVSKTYKPRSMYEVFSMQLADLETQAIESVAIGDKVKIINIPG